MPKRDGPIWNSVTVLVEHDTCPSVQCNNCEKKFRGGATVYGKIKTEQRSRLGHAVADKLVYAHEALHLREKLQSASYVQTVEKWDTDSDSNESDDEEDLKR